MAFFTILTIVFATFSLLANGLNNNFDAYYRYLWGGDHFSVDPQGTEAQIKIDQSSGAGFRSKLEYGSGLFHIRMKISEKKSEGVVTSFYLTTAPDNNPNPGNYSEINYEFLGTTGVLQTNVYANDTGNRQQKFKLWFDPSKDFHTYQFLWNSYQIVFMVDNIPIRVFKNNKAQGLPYVIGPMHVQASIWNAPFTGPVDWTQAPYIAHFRDFGFNACPAGEGEACDSDKYFWNTQNYRQLNATQQKIMAEYRKNYMTYNYCSDPSKWRKECSVSV